MEIKVLEDTKNKLVFEIKGVGHTFCNAFKEELTLLSYVDIATYSVSHPLVGIPKFHVITKSKDPRTAVKEAVKNLKSKNADFLKSFNALK